ncbi:hypothetical protein SORBI_3008G104701 [Sorghum bicolor]|uniref:Ubiquitin-like protease family profile domain-containing protein n=1 Tax=Sorghum bicolor TaxID=4558 RepID=A0A1Z5R620_SORBI|nr:hypothetical protein SORBI_3008G104701 [Sorghum bicolor]
MVYSRLEMLKKKLISSLSHNKKPDPRPKVGFSRFSVSTFSSVTKSLSTKHQDVIQKYGFGSLLMFDECSVPRNFVHWVARLVNFNSGDIVVNGKVISLTKEAVHLVLDLPFGGEPFPTDYASGKACLLSRFGKDSVPPISYFSEALISKKELSDDNMFVCFIVVALSTFLCPNSSVVPSQRFFGIFEDLEKIRSYDWCGFILSWLVEYIKLFNQLKGCKSTHQATLGGCLYFLVVIPSTIPRILVWKKDMITRYASLDLKEEGCYGYHPIMDYSRTCYAKDMRLLPQICDQHIDPEFVSQLDRYARCKLPAELKDGICNLIEKHCLNCGVSVNFDVNSMNALSDVMRLTFIKLWKHVYSVTKMSQHLVLELSPDVKVVGSKNFVQNVGEMTKKSNALYNSKLDLHGSSRSSPVVQPPVPSDGTLPSYARLSHSYVPKSQDLSLGGKVPLHGPRRFVNPGPLFRGDYETDKCKFYKVNKSEVDNYKILCVLASSEFHNEDAVSLSGVRCTFWSLGESLKPGGFVNTFVVSCFCYSLFSKPNGHPYFSKRHYFFSNIGKHWFVFVVDIKDRHFVFLDSYYDRNS